MQQTSNIMYLWHGHTPAARIAAGAAPPGCICRGVFARTAPVASWTQQRHRACKPRLHYEASSAALAAAFASACSLSNSPGR
eukprot:364586-Chlamydomonas_euryale.AAC.21